MRVQLDCRRLLCPMPVIRVQNRAEELQAGDEIEAVCTDPGALQDIPAWCRLNGHEILETHRTATDCRVVVRLGEMSR